ncbi:hypothetical protein GIB67_036149 [Kingdonia uniflora]|uniref:Uncharacterized protein n=1 Tax=Kingdonia uniflora TaxID=39325 RepID=A0A7J7N8Y0_9MAGN|nr:hypothetical protein GIB67_036149 [Kingdonia uniflora]
MEYWFYEYCGVGHPIVKEDAKFLAYPHLRAWERGNMRKTNDQATNLFLQDKYHIDHHIVETITWDPWLEPAVSKIDDALIAKLLSCKRMPLQAEFLGCKQFVVGEERETYASYWAEQILEVGHMLIDSQRMGNIDLFGPTALRVGITPVMVMTTSIHSLSQDFSLPGEADGPDPGWHMEWIGRQSARDAQRLQELTDENDTLRRHFDSADEQLYVHDLQLRRGSDVRVVQRPPRGGARARQHGSGPRTRGGSTSRREWGTGDDSE